MSYCRCLSNPANSPVPGAMPNIRGMFTGWPHATGIEIAAIAVVAVAVWITAGHAGNEFGLPAVLAAGVLYPPHVYMADCALLIPAAIMELATTKNHSTRTLCIFQLLPVPWILMLAGSAFPARMTIVFFVIALAWEAWPRGNAVYSWFRSTVEKKNFSSSAAVSGASEP